VKRYTITRPLKELPPLVPKTIKVTSATKIDFVKQFQGICINLTVNNHGADATYKLNDEGDIMSSRATTGQEIFENCHIEQVELITVSDMDLLCIIAPLSLLKEFNAVESG